jgi:putative flippase GtrA
MRLRLPDSALTRPTVVAQAIATLRRLASYGAVGVLNTSIDVGAFWVLTALAGLPPLVANVVSFCLGAANSFAVNGLVTFADRGVALASAARVARFAAVTVVCLAVSSLALWLALALVPPLAAKLASVAMTVAVGYVLLSRLVYR